jgi:hypothetical protein
MWLLIGGHVAGDDDTGAHELTFDAQNAADKLSVL